MSVKFMYETPSEIEADNNIPTQGVLNRLDLSPKNLGKDPISAMPKSWKAVLLNWASKGPIAANIAPTSRKIFNHFPPINYAAWAISPAPHSLCSTERAPLTAESGNT